MDKWPFDLWLHYAVRGLKLTPSEFWTLPIREWLVLTKSLKAQGISRESLQEMMKIFPDRSENNGHRKGGAGPK